MLALYLASLGFGAVLLGVSVFLGGADKDFDKDVDVVGDADADAEADVDGDAEGEAGLEKDVTSVGDAFWLPVFSMRFWSFGAAAFGFVGTALTLGDLPWWLVLALAVVLGAGSGTAAASFFRALKKDNVTGDITLHRMVGEEARALLPIAHGERGTIVWSGPTGRVELLATTLDEQPIPVGAKVIIASVRDGVADVSVLPPDGLPHNRVRETARAKQST